MIIKKIVTERIINLPEVMDEKNWLRLKFDDDKTNDF